MKIRKTYKFAFYSSLYITFFSSLAVYFSAYFILGIWLKATFILTYIASIFLFTFIVIQYRVERFIYKRIKNIYDSVSILDNSDFNKTSITSDIATLSREVQKFAEDKQQQIQSLNLRENYRREFLGNISHELKTPLFTVQGYLLTLLDGALKDKKIREKYIERANKGVDRLISIVKDLDLISRLEAGNLDLNKQPFDLVELIQDIFELLEMKSKKREISLKFDRLYNYPIMVIADEERIEQVITNLVVNSIKYGNVGGTTIVRIEITENGKVLTRITDDGEGIEEKHKARIFERFYRVDKSRSREEGGSGLGLSIVKHIIEAHNETISVKSEYGKGSEFAFTLEKLEQV
jgi:two-component system phosphate regulon sensor histidine kinase PhoR